MGLAVAVVVLFVADVAASALHTMYPHHFGVGATSSVIEAVFTIVNLVWVFKFRNRLNEFFASPKGDRYWLGVLLTFFFGCFTCTTSSIN
jgi:hypothetical protein